MEKNKVGISVSYNTPDTEKVSVNMNAATLAQIDLLVDNGYYSNRSDFINQAVRQALDAKQSTLDRLIERKEERARGGSEWFLGVMSLDREYFEQAKRDGVKIRLTGYGLLILNEDIPDELLFEALESVKIRGRVRCRKSVKEHYGIK